ncbi:38_t:CDS:2, partial [Scutellospora calospora]
AQGTFRYILLAADNFYEKMSKNQKERKILMSQIRSYRYRTAPFDIPFRWYYGKRCTWLSLSKIENMQKLSAFYLANSKKELPYFSANNKVQDVEFPEEEVLKIEKLLNLDAADFTNDLGEIVFDTNFESSEEKNVNVQINDAEGNVDEENWDPEKEADI